MHEVVDTDAPQRSAEVHRNDVQLRGLSGDHPAQLVGRQRSISDEAAQDGVVVPGEDLRRRQREPRVRELPDDDGRTARPDILGLAHRQHVRTEATGDCIQRAADVSAGSVDLVDEDDRRHPEPPQRSREQQRLCLHALDG